MLTVTPRFSYFCSLSSPKPNEISIDNQTQSVCLPACCLFHPLSVCLLPLSLSVSVSLPILRLSLALPPSASVFSYPSVCVCMCVCVCVCVCALLKEIEFITNVETPLAVQMRSSRRLWTRCSTTWSRCLTWAK